MKYFIVRRKEAKVKKGKLCATKYKNEREGYHYTNKFSEGSKNFTKLHLNLHVHNKIFRDFDRNKNFILLLRCKGVILTQHISCNFLYLKQVSQFLLLDFVQAYSHILGLNGRFDAVVCFA